MNTVREDDAKGLERFAEALERAVINLKENDRQSDSRDGTLYTIILQKIPERLLALYYRWIKQNQEQDSFEMMKDWMSGEAEYRVEASEIRFGIGVDAKTTEKTVSWRRSDNRTKSLVSSIDEAENRSTRSANSVVTVIQFGSAMYLEGDQLKEYGKRVSDWGSVIDVLVTIILETRVQSTENAKSTGVKITITGYCMQKKLADKERHKAEPQTE